MGYSAEWTMFEKSSAQYIIDVTTGKNPKDALSNFVENLKLLDRYINDCYPSKNVKKSAQNLNIDISDLYASSNLQLLGDYLNRKLPTTIESLKFVWLLKTSAIVMLGVLLSN